MSRTSQARQFYRMRRIEKLKKEQTMSGQENVTEKKNNAILWGRTNWRWLLTIALLLVALLLWRPWSRWTVVERHAAQTVVIEEQQAATPVPATTPPLTSSTTASISATAPITLTNIAKGDTIMVPAGNTVLGDVVATWPGFDQVMSAYDNGQSGEGTILWVASGQASVHAPWGAGVLPCTTRDQALKLVDNELAQGCGDSGGCKTVRLITLSANGTSVEFFD